MNTNENGRRRHWAGVAFALVVLLVAVAAPGSALAAERVEEFQLGEDFGPEPLGDSIQANQWSRSDCVDDIRMDIHFFAPFTPSSGLFNSRFSFIDQSGRFPQ